MKYARYMLMRGTRRRSKGAWSNSRGKSLSLSFSRDTVGLNASRLKPYRSKTNLLLLPFQSHGQFFYLYEPWVILLLTRGSRIIPFNLSLSV